MGAKMVSNRVVNGEPHIRCPICTTEQAISKDEFEVSAQGLVHPDFVCMHRENDEYCRFSGPVRLKG